MAMDHATCMFRWSPCGKKRYSAQHLERGEVRFPAKLFPAENIKKPAGFWCSLMPTSQNSCTLITLTFQIPLSEKSRTPTSLHTFVFLGDPGVTEEGPGPESGAGTGQQYPGGARADQHGDPTPAGEGRRRGGAGT